MKIFYLLFISLFIICKISSGQQIQSFPLSSIKLLDSDFKNAQQVDMKYILDLDVDRLLAPYLKEAGLKPKAEQYGNWENTGLDGHIGGHYLSALSLMYASTGNQELLDRLNYMINQLYECQKKNGNGYVGGIPGGKKMWDEIASGKIDAGGFSLNGKWVPLYNIHKVYAGLRDAWIYTNNEKAKGMLIALSDWCLELVKDLSDAQIQQMLISEHGGMNEIFADVASITSEEKYLELARKFSHHKILDPLLKQQDQLNGQHANTQIPKVIGYKRIAEVASDSAWEAASTFFWNTVVENRTISIGGNSVREHFHPDDDFSSMVESRQGPETCNTYNMLKLTRQLFSTQHDAKYVDFYERGLYNHILSSQHPEKGGFVYFTPMRPNHYRVYSQVNKGFWCCVGSGLENHGKYGELIYSYLNNDLYVNLFIASELTWKEKGLQVIQNTNFPYSDISNLTIKTKKPQKLALKIRYPGWVNEKPMQIWINGKTVKIENQPSSYITINRKWRDGDKIKIQLPMHIYSEKLPDDSPWVSFEYGPIVLGAVTDSTGLKGLFADDSRMGHVASGPLYPTNEAPLVMLNNDSFEDDVKLTDKKSLTFEAPSLFYPEKFKHLKLVPFYTIHGKRYSVYFRETTPSEYEESKRKLELMEKKKLELEKQTLDYIAPGEQQPESDHFIKTENSNAGVHKNRHWRDASGWFSYELRNPEGVPCSLRITYYGMDTNRNFDILINNEIIATVNLKGERGDQFFDVDYKITQNLIDNSKKPIILKFRAHTNSTAGGIYGIRLLKEK